MGRYYRDRIRIEYNAAAESDQFPLWKTLVERLGCWIESLTAETAGFGGRELERADALIGEADYRIETHHHTQLGRITANMRVIVLTGPFPDMVLSIVAVGPVRQQGRSTGLVLLCREEEPRRTAA